MKVSGWYAVGFYGVIAAVIFFFGWKCGSGNAKKVSHAVTIRDTVTLPGQLIIDTAYVPKPVKVVVVKPDTSYRRWSGVYKFKRDTNRVDTGVVRGEDDPYGWPNVNTVRVTTTDKFVHRCGDTVYYRDTVKVSHGSVTITDTIADNRITGRSVKADIDVPTVTKTVTLTQPKRAIAYFGLQVQGGPQNYLFSLGADLSLKTKNDRIYSAGVSLTRDNQVLYDVGVKFPIRLRK